jgi:hypothetical protein
MSPKILSLGVAENDDHLIAKDMRGVVGAARQFSFTLFRILEYSVPGRAKFI